MRERRIDMEELYNTNPEFKEYVDHLAKHYNEGRSITVDECLQLAIVKDYAEYLQKRGK